MLLMGASCGQSNRIKREEGSVDDCAFDNIQTPYNDFQCEKKFNKI